eukprot:CAMPEP_0170185820 /NCGR_PEP_ID=MMETSP0040_2-20121228/37557_1 /TAXON_ID=641309 /ORGANISM="Lotharella oceanica, Strain CCMP622" /LENGTH=442 /DNA_ID=CAMNT_0010432349 /DNA_START=60 /DNA_END=1388 /DNA_ORIENTATION=+
MSLKGGDGGSWNPCCPCRGSDGKYESDHETYTIRTKSDDEPTRTPHVGQAQLPYDADSLRRAAFWVVVIGAVFMCIVLVMEATNASNPVELPDFTGPVGWIAVLGALFLFGSVGLMFKEPADEYGKKPDAVLFQAFNALGIFLVGVPLMIFECRSSGKDVESVVDFSWFDWLGLLGAVDIIIVSFWAHLSTQLIGYAMAPAVLNGVGMITSFLWGKIFFSEPIRNMVGALFSLFLLVLGVMLLGATQMANMAAAKREGRVGGHQTQTSSMVTAAAAAAGFGAGVMSGVFDGALMVPYKLHERRLAGPAGLSPKHTLAYLASFSVGSLLTTPVLIAVAAARESKDELGSDWKGTFSRKLRRSAVPGGVTGVVWAMGNFLSVHASKHLGMSVGFPLVQTGILVAAVWGVFFFQDLNLSRLHVLLLFLAALGSLMAGAACLAQMG